MRTSLALLALVLTTSTAHAGIRIDNPKATRSLGEANATTTETEAQHARSADPGIIQGCWSLDWLSLSVCVSAEALTVNFGSPSADLSIARPKAP